MAMLTGIALVIALVADMTLLPALLIALDKDKIEAEPVMSVQEAPNQA
jgi:predicted RND superfamily exporter protein